MFSNFILITIIIPDRSFVFIWTLFKDRLDSLNWTARLLEFHKRFCLCLLQLLDLLVHKGVSVLKVDLILWGLSIRRSFSPVLSTYGKFLLILISSSWISMACVSCCYWGKLWLLVILLKILLILLSWHPFFFNTCFIIAFSLCKSSLFVIMEYDLLDK